MRSRRPYAARRILSSALLVALLATVSHRGTAQTPPSATLTFSPVADTWVDSGTPTTNFGADTILRADASPIRISYLRFNVTGVNGRTVQSARLRLGVSAAGVGGTVHRITNTTWTENAVTYNNRPAVDGPALASLGALAAGATVTFDLGAAVTGDGVVSLAIDSTDSNAVSYNSSSATSGQKPVLELTVATPPNPTVTIQHPPNGGTFFVGDPVTLQGAAQDGTGTDLSATIAWRSNVAGALGTGATVTTSGLGVGAHTITAGVTDRFGQSATSQIGVTVETPPPGNTEPLVTISAPADGRTLAANLPVAFTGSASDLEDGDVTANLVWSSDRDGALGTGGNVTHALTPGTHHITARVTDAGGLAGTASVTVTVETGIVLEFPAIADASVDSSLPTTNFGTSPLLAVDANAVRIAYLRFAVTGLGTRTLLGAAVELVVDGASGAESTAGGTLSAIATGGWNESTVTYANRPATNGSPLGRAGPVTLGQTVDLDAGAAVTGDGTYDFAITSASSDEVEYRSREGGPAPKLLVAVAANPPAVSITAPPDQSVFFQGSPIVFAGNASDVEDGNLTDQMSWTAGPGGALGAGGTITVGTLALGAHTITAAATDSDGLHGERAITVRVRAPNQPPAVTISSPADGASVPAGTSVNLAAAATDDWDVGLTSQIRWTSSRDGTLGTGGSRSAILSEGAHTVTAAVTDSDHAIGSAEVHVTVTPTPPVVTITAPADGTTIFSGATLALTGSASDATDGDLTAGLAWTSDRDGALGTGASVSATHLSVGTHTITAAATDHGGLRGQAQRMVIVRAPNVGPTVTIVAPANGQSLITGRPALLAATATDPEDGNLGASVRWTSSRDGVLGTGDILVVPSLTLGAHTLAAAVTDRDGATTTASVTVTVTAATLSFPAVADAYVDANNASSKFGTATTLFVDNSPIKQTFLRFSVSGVGTLAVQQAVLRLTAGSASASASNLGGELHTITNTTWAETTTTYANRPSVDGPIVATRASAVAVGATVDFDATSAVRGDGTVNFGLVTSSSDEVIYNSREATSGQPQLLLTLSGNQAPIVRITAPTSGARVAPGVPVTLTATATDAEQGDLGGQLQWTSSLDGALGTGRSLTLATLQPGTHTITARVTDAGGLGAQAQVTLTVTHKPTIAITAPASGAVVFTSQLPLTLAGTAADVEDGNLSARIDWRSDLNGALARGATITAALSVGTHVVTATVTDDNGLSSSTQVTVRVRGPNTPPRVTITAPAAGTAVPAGTPIALTATATDDFDGDLGAQLRWTSSRDGALGTGASRSVVLREGTHTVTAAATDSDGATGSATVDVTILPSPPVVTITGPAVGTHTTSGTSVTFTGTALDATDGNLGAGLRWSSDRDGGLGTGASVTTNRLTVGTHTITAAATDGGGLTGQAQLVFVVRPPNIPPILTILAPTAGTTLLGGKPILLAATASDAEDGDLAAAVRWTSSRDGALGTGGTLVVPSLSVGAHVLTATVTDLDGAPATGTVAVTVSPATLTFAAVADTYVDASTATSKFGTATALWVDNSPIKQAFLRFTVAGVGPLTVGQAHLKLTATSAKAAASNAGGVLHTITNTSWSEATTTYSSRPATDGPTIATQGAVATSQVVDFDVTSVVRADGTVNFGLVTSSSDEVVYNSREATSGQPQLVLTLSTNQAPAVRITAPASGARVAPGAPVTLTATATDAEDGDLAGQVQWTSSLDGAVGAGRSLTLAALRPGTHTITARVADATGVAAQAQITLTVTHRPTVSIGAPADGAVVFTNQLPLMLAGSATDVEDGNLSARIDWRSDRDGALARGATITASVLSLGTHILTATVVDDDGLSAQAQRTIRVRGPNAPPHVSISAPAPGTAVAAGTSIALAATATDDFDGDLGAQLRWTSSRDGALGTGPSRTVVLSEGMHTLTAAATDSDGATGTATVDVTIVASPPVVTITAPPAGAHVFTGTTVTFTGTALDATDGNLGAGLRWSSDRDGFLGTGPSVTTNRLTIGAHTITATATDRGGLVGLAQRSVVVRSPNVAPTLTIQSPAAGTALLGGKPVLLAATASDAEDGDLAAAVRWTSSRDGALGTGGTLVVPSLSVGSHTLTATVADLDGASATATVAVTVSAGTLAFAPVADTYVDASKTTTKFGTATALWVDNSPIKQAFLRFTVAGVSPFTVGQAHLKLTATSAAAAASNSGGAVHTITNTTWSEASTTYASRPATDGPTVATQAAVAVSQVVDFDVTSAVRADGTVNFGLVTSSTDEVVYNSREATAGRPQLILTLSSNQAPAIRITAPAANAVLDVAAPATFTAIATDAESGDLGASVRWTSSLDGALGTGASITPSALSRGVHTITAAVTDAGGRSATATVTVTVDTLPTLAITAPAPDAVFEPGMPVVFAGTAHDAEDGDLGAGITWRSNLDGTLGTGGIVTTSALSGGRHTITASVADQAGKVVTATTTVIIDATPVVTITIPAVGALVDPGESVTLAATARDGEEGDLSSAIAWRSSRDGALGTGARITVATLSTGTHVITAASTDRTGRTGTAMVTITVDAPPVVQITVPANGAVLEPTGVTFAATATDAEEGNLAAAIAWTSSRDGSLGTGGSITPSRLTSGTHTITAAVTDRSGRTGRAPITVTVNASPTVGITAPASGTIFEPGTPVALVSAASDLEDGDLGATISWNSSRDGALGVGRTLSLQTLTSGTHTITASVTDHGGKTGTASITVVVDATPAVTITAPVAQSVFDPGAPITLTGTAHDAEEGDLTAAMTWTSSVAGLLGTGGTVSVSTLHSGTHVITAAATDAVGQRGTATTTIVVDAAPVVTLVAPASGAVFEPGTPIAFTATASDAEDGDLSAALAWTSDRDGGLGTGSTISLGTLGIGTHTITAAVHDASGRTAAATVVVTISTRPTVAIAAPANAASFEPAAPVVFAAAASDAEDGDLTSAVAWTSDRDGALGTGGTITAAHLSTGTHHVTASVRDRSSLVAEATITVIVNATPAVAIATPHDGAVFEPGAPVVLAASATDAEDGDLTAAIAWTSDRAGALGVGGTITVDTLDSGTHTITAAATDGGGKTGRASITVTVNATPTIAIDAPATGATFEPGAAITLTATATDREDGNLSTAIAWTSSLDGALGTGGTLSVHTLRSGTHTIAATIVDHGGKSARAEITVVVNATPVLTATAPLDGASFSPGDPVALAATATDAEDGDLSAAIAWTSSLEGSLGTGPSVTVNTLHSGTHTITATVTDSGGKHASVARTVVVNAAPVVAITAPHDGDVFQPAVPVTLAAGALDLEDGDLGAAVVWTSDRAGALGVGATISVAFASGTHTITAAATDAGGKVGRATITLTINATPTIAIDAPSTGATFEPGAPITLTATATDLEDGDLGGTVTWTSNLDGALGDGGTLTVHTLRSGTHTITAAVTDHGGKSAHAEISVVVNATPVLTVTAPADGASVVPGETVQLSATATDAEDGDLSTAIAWTSSLDGALGTGPSVAANTLRSGTHAISATVTDAGGKHATVTRTVVVNAAPTLAITAPPANSTFVPGASIRFTATATDAEDGVLAPSWTSSLDGALGTGSTLDVTTLRSGTHVITASVRDSGGRTAADQVTVIVNAPPTVAITAPAGGAVIMPGAVVQLLGTAGDLEDGDLASAIAWTSSVDGPLGTGGSVGTTLHSGVHTLTASVADQNGATATASISVVVNAPPTLAIDAPANGATVVPGLVTLAATASDLEDHDLGAGVAWTSSLDGALGTGATLSVGTLRSGMHTITASVSDTGGRTATASVSLLVDTPPTIAITSPTDGATVTPGDTAHLVTTASDADEGDLGTAVVWTSSLDGALGTGATLDVTTLRSGTHTITATVTDQSGETAVAQLTLRVNAAPTVTITSPAGGTTFAPGETVPLAGTAGDLEDGDLGSAIAWTSNVDGALGTGATLSVATLHSGTHTITATVTDAGGRSASATIGITVAPLFTLQGTFTSGYNKLSLALKTRIDATAATFFASPSNLYPLNLAGDPGVVVAGGIVLGQYDRTWSWDQMHNLNNAGVAFANSGFTVDGLRVDNVTDAIRPKSGGGFLVKNVWVTYARDDCVENDHLNDGVIDDSLFDGCYTGFSARPSQAIIDSGYDGTGKVWTIQHSLVRLQPMIGPRGGSTDNYGTEGFFKWHNWDHPGSSLSPNLSLHGNIFMAERKGQVSSDRMGIPPGHLDSCSDNIMVWLGPGNYPATLPPCFTVTTDRSVWDNAVADWHARHPNVGAPSP